MPSGRYVTAQVYCFDRFSDCFMSVTVHALSGDRGLTQGLCGNYDGDAANDLTQGGLQPPAYPPEPVQLSNLFQ